MAWTALPVLLLAALSVTVSSESTPTVPLSYVLADTAFLADEISSSKDGVGGVSRVLEYLHHVERTMGGMATGLLAPAAFDAHPRARRQLPTDPLTTLTEDRQGVYLLKRLFPRFNIPAKFPNDVTLFPRLEAEAVAWYAAALEADGESPQTNLANSLVLYKLMGNRFEKQTSEPVFGASVLSVHEIDGWTYLLAAERASHLRVAPEHGPILYRLSLNGSSLVKVMTVPSQNPSDVVFWKFMNAHYLVVTSEFTNTTDGGVTFAADTLVYKWLGEHFDIIQRLPTSGAKAATSFTVDSNQYLVVANHIDDQGETNIDSTVYRFDVVKGKFVEHQRLRTHAAVDVSFFTMHHSRGQHHFLAVANEYYQGLDKTKNYATTSVLYKWTNDGFVPFQSFQLVGATQWAPYSGPRGEMVLLGASAYGLHAYQYDGWRFRQLAINGDLLGSGFKITSLRSAAFESEGLIVIASKQNAGVQTNVFAMQFDKALQLDELQEELSFWCSKQLGELAKNSAAKMLERVNAAPKWTSDVVEVNSIVFESNSTINTLAAGSVTSKNYVINPEFVATLNSLAGELQQSRNKLAEAQATMDQALKQDRHNIVRGTVVLHNASVSCAGPCRFGHAHVGSLNNENAVSLVKNMIRLDADVFTEGALRFSSVVVPGNLQTIKVLGETAPLVDKVNTKHILGSLVVNEFVVDTGLNVNGTIDGVHVSPSTVLLVDGDQTLSGFDSVTHWQVDKLVLHGKVNGMTIDVSRPELPPEVAPTQPPMSLTVGDVSLGGLLGGVDIADVASRALRTSGPQQVTGHHSFKELAVQDVASRWLDMNTIVRTDLPKEKLPGPLRFNQPLVADKVQVYKRLNDIGVAADGSMDLLLNRALAGPQRVEAPKWVRRLRVTELARIHGRILGLVLPAEDEPLVRVVQDDILVEGDVSISGRVDVRGTVTATNILEPTSGVTVLNVLRDAVPVTGPLPPTVLVEDIEVTNVDVTIVNGVPTDAWILDAPGQVVQLTKTAKFTGGMTVTGSSTLTGTVNGVDLRILDQTALKTTGDQVILGHKTFPSISATSAWSNDTLLGGARWLELWARRLERQGHSGVVKLEDDVEIDGTLTLKRLGLDGLLGGVDIGATLQDSVFKDVSVTVIDGPKTFQQTVTVDNLRVEPSVAGTDLSGIQAATVPGGAAHPDGQSFAFQSIAINRPLSVNKLRYTGTLDGVSDAEWAVPWLEVEGDQTLYGPQTVHGDVEVMLGVNVAKGVNNLDLSAFAQQVARIDDPNLRLGSVTFDAPVVATGPVTAGSVSGVQLSDALLARGATKQELRGRVVLAGGLEAKGALKVVGTLSGEDFKALCDFANASLMSSSAPQHLDVKGDLLLDEELVLGKTLNGRGMGKLMNNTWLRDRPAHITGRMEFGDVQFSNDVTVEGHIDGVNLDAISQRYVSLNKDETVLTSIRVAKGIKVEGRVVADAVEVGGLVSGYPLADLPKVVLMDGPDQDVLARMNFGIVETTSSLNLDGTINGLDLARDVVLNKDSIGAALDHNVVLDGKRMLGDVSVIDLGLQPDVRVQGVDVAAWDRDAVRVSGDYVITGSKTLHRPQVVGGLNVDGLVAGVRVNASHLLLRHSDQVVTGSKTLTPAPLPGLGLRIQSLEVTGQVNGVGMRQLLANQAYKTSDVAVVTPVQLAAGAKLHSGAAWVDGVYQGVNLTDMIYAAQHPLTLDQYAEQHEALRRMAEHVQQSLRAQGYYLNYYHTAVSLRSGVRAVLPLGKAATEDSMGDPAFAIAIVMERVAGQSLIVDFFSWSVERNSIVTHPTLPRVSLSRDVRLIAPATYAGLSAIYWEEEESNGVHVGRVMGLLRDGRLGKAEVLRNTLASAWVSMTEVGDMACLIRGSPGSYEGRDGFCALHCLGQGRENLVVQPLEASRPTHAVSLTVRGVPHVFVASGSSEVSEGEVDVWRWEGSSLRLSQKMGVMNASSLAAVEYRGVHYLAAASGHVADSPHEGVVHISRFYGDKWAHWMSVEVEGPRAMQFATLPSGQLVLYVATTCPTDSLVVLQYRGVSGFVRRASAAVPMGGVLSAFTTSRHHHLVAVSGGRQGALLQAAFKGNWEASELAARALARGG